MEEIKEEELEGIKEEDRQRCEIWSRVMGYLRPTYMYNKGKYSEFTDRKLFKIRNEAGTGDCGNGEIKPRGTQGENHG